MNTDLDTIVSNDFEDKIITYFENEIKDFTFNLLDFLDTYFFEGKKIVKERSSKFTQTDLNFEITDYNTINDFVSNEYYFCSVDKKYYVLKDYFFTPNFLPQFLIELDDSTIEDNTDLLHYLNASNLTNEDKDTIIDYVVELLFTVIQKSVDKIASFSINELKDKNNNEPEVVCDPVFTSVFLKLFEQDLKEHFENVLSFIKEGFNNDTKLYTKKNNQYNLVDSMLHFCYLDYEVVYDFVDEISKHGIGNVKPKQTVSTASDTIKTYLEVCNTLNENFYTDIFNKYKDDKKLRETFNKNVKLTYSNLSVQEQIDGFIQALRYQIVNEFNKILYLPIEDIVIEETYEENRLSGKVLGEFINEEIRTIYLATFDNNLNKQVYVFTKDLEQFGVDVKPTYNPQVGHEAYHHPFFIYKLNKIVEDGFVIINEQSSMTLMSDYKQMFEDIKKSVKEVKTPKIYKNIYGYKIVDTKLYLLTEKEIKNIMNEKFPNETNYFITRREDVLEEEF